MMNLLGCSWLPVRYRDGRRGRIRPDEMVGEAVIALDSGRPDFDAALYQWLIGLLQTTVAPEDSAVWRAWYDRPPAAEKLSARFDALSHAFELDGSGPRFMQDLELTGGEDKPISGLLIDAPGGNALKLNLDHFVKRGQVSRVCPACAAIALFTLQLNAPAGGVGHRTSLRGGGPLTTLLVPKAEEETLWRTVWLNVLTTQQFEPERVYEGSAQGDTAIFPWLTPTRTSEGDRKALPIDTHPLQMYWAMPRRIRLNLGAVEEGACDLCGETSAALVTSFTTKNYGTSYAQFVHPLSPHSIDEKRNLKLPRHGQPGGVGYRDWLGLVFLREAEGREPAKVVLAAAGGMDTRRRVSGLGIWAFGYDMDNMKARAWCDARLPWFDVPESQRSECVQVVGRAIQAAEKVEYLLRDALRRVWFGKLKQFDRDKRKADWDMPKSAKLDSDAMLALQATFWRETTQDFFVLVKAILNEEDEQVCLQVWHAALWKKVQSLFEQATRDAACDVEQLKRQVVVAEELRGYCHGRALREALGLIVEEGTSRRKRA